MIDDAITAFPALSVQRLCALFGISRSGYYARRGSSAAAAAREVALRDAIERLTLASPGYG